MRVFTRPHDTPSRNENLWQRNRRFTPGFGVRSLRNGVQTAHSDRERKHPDAGVGILIGSTPYQSCIGCLANKCIFSDLPALAMGLLPGTRMHTSRLPCCRGLG